MKYLLIASLWAAYCALHSYLISIRFTQLMSRLLKKYYAFYRLFYVIISIVLIIPLLNYSARFDNEIIVTYSPILDIIRQIFLYGSLLMFFWSFFFDYDSLSFFGLRQIMGMSKEKKPENGIELKKRGLLGIVRHPMYLALLICLWCSIHSMSSLVINCVLTVYILIGTILEEKKLILEFGEKYIKYQQEVPMLIPFTKLKSK